jgi:hypothetical protein
MGLALPFLSTIAAISNGQEVMVGFELLGSPQRDITPGIPLPLAFCSDPARC